MNTLKHELWDADNILFASMKNHYRTPNEENFFRNVQYKQEYECTALNDLLVSEYENSDEIYVIREEYEEYVVGRGIGSDGSNEVHVMCLFEALNLDLGTIGYPGSGMTLWAWLRECDYAVVNYERNYDIIDNGKRGRLL